MIFLIASLVAWNFCHAQKNKKESYTIETFTDERDGKSYKSVKIGNQVWMAENLNYEGVESWCYDDKKENCAIAGRLYKWEGAKKACPAGWHLPTNSEWQTLVDLAGGSDKAGAKLKATEGWKKEGGGKDKFGFHALPGGKREAGVSGVFYFDFDSYGYWWTSTEQSSSKAVRRDMSYVGDLVFKFPYEKWIAYSVRCVKD